jgi:hypothetical protein
MRDGFRLFIRIYNEYSLQQTAGYQNQNNLSRLLSFLPRIGVRDKLQQESRVKKTGFRIKCGMTEIR